MTSAPALRRRCKQPRNKRPSSRGFRAPWPQELTPRRLCAPPWRAPSGRLRCSSKGAGRRSREAAMGVTSREIRLKNRPDGLPQAENFELVTVELGDPGPGQVLVKNHWMSVDPYMRGRMYDRPSYVPPFELGKA